MRRELLTIGSLGQATTPATPAAGTALDPKCLIPFYPLFYPDVCIPSVPSDNGGGGGGLLGGGGGGGTVWRAPVWVVPIVAIAVAGGAMFAIAYAHRRRRNPRRRRRRSYA